ncbi:MAG TPA: pyruvate kinase [Candidatus Methylomirabilis sp.]|nr:pyruvate kinase [Candidatus Methylomirabilis sp.]
MRRTKIVCTLGPSSRTEGVIRGLIRKGMDVARLNFAHGTHADHRRLIELVRRLSQEEGRPVAILQDLAGPKMRIGELATESIYLRPGDLLTITTRKVVGTPEVVSVGHPELLEQVEVGDPLLLSDGRLRLEVTGKGPEEVRCRVVVGGTLFPHKGVTLPEGGRKVKALTEKDRTDLAFAVQQGVDYLSVSFVRTAEDIHQAKALLQEAGAEIPVVAKIEKRDALENIEEILEATDSIMIARGDLGAEIPLEEVPLAQKRLIAMANALAKPAITATQMLSSMVASPRPTRAEASDVANAVLDGTDAVMLSEESATGRHPVEAVAVMARIAEAAERALEDEAWTERRRSSRQARTVHFAICEAACLVAQELKAKAIVCPTRTGTTARLIAGLRPRQPILAASPSEVVARRLAMVWGVTPMVTDKPGDMDTMMAQAKEAAVASGLVQPGDRFVITAGPPTGPPGTTNLIKVDVA